MQISRRFILACVTAATLSPIFLSAQETDAQRIAREALDQKMKELQTAPAAAAPAQPAPAVAPVVSVPVKVTTTTVAAAGTPELVAPAPSDPQSIERAREAMRQKLKEAPPVQPAPVVVAPAAVKTAPPVAAPQTTAPEPVKVVPAAVAPAAVVVHHTAPPAAPAGEYMPWPSGSGPDSSEKARQALYHQWSAQPVQQPTQAEIIAKEKAAAADWSASEEAKTKKVAKKTPTAFEPLTGPPTGLSAAKEQQLQDLLVQYRADLVTPEQYHAQRAKILAHP